VIQQPAGISPEPTDEEAAAIVAAMQTLLGGAGDDGAGR